MAWLGETFGESLNSLKGQITKITKEVLAENPDNDSSEDELNLQERLQEFDALCASKDLEIISLRDENKKLSHQFQTEIEYLKNENKRLSRNGNASRGFEINQDQTQHICELEKQLSAIVAERDTLSLSLDQLHIQHQQEISQVISVRDNLKQELKQMKDDYNHLKVEYQKLVDQHESLSNKNFLQANENDKCTEDEIIKLRQEIEQLQLKIEADCKEKEESFQTIKKEIVNHEQLKGKLEKLVHEIETLNEDKFRLDAESQKLRADNEHLKKDLSNNTTEMGVLQKENQELLSKVAQLNNDFNCQLHNLTDSQENIQTHLQRLMMTFNVHHEDDLDQTKFIDTIEDNWNNLLAERKELEEKYKQSVEGLQEEIKILKEENWNFQNEIKTHQQKCLIQSQTDDVKRLNQEISKLAASLQSKDKELYDCVLSRNNLEQELNILKSVSARTEQELNSVTREKEELGKEILLWQNTIESKEKQFYDLYEEKVKLEERLSHFENQHSEMLKSETELKMKLNDFSEANKKLQNEMEVTLNNSSNTDSLQKELDDITVYKSQLESNCSELIQVKHHLEDQLENLKAQIIVKDTQLSEMKKRNNDLEEELKTLGMEAKNWKEASVDLELQRQDLCAENERLQIEYGKLNQKPELSEDVQVKQEDDSSVNRREEYEQFIAGLSEENQQLKSQIEQLQCQRIENATHLESSFQHHRRSKSAVDFDAKSEDPAPERLTQVLQQEQAKYRALQNEYKELKEKESNSRRELERLRLHLVEVEDHYTAEAVESEKTLNEYKSKLNAAEEQMKNSSTIYKSANVRANQHLESLQSQIRLISIQRDDLQAKLSAAEDEVQKHNASLTSLQIVLEQFQQDKEREIEGIITKYEYQIQLSHKRFKELETEIESLVKQLAEAKNGLNAASRLGEQLERKSQQIATLEENLALMRTEMKEMENRLSLSSQSNIGKIDKSLIKNLIVGYIASHQADRKSQVLRIMASVLDFNQEERIKLGVDSPNTGWLSNLLHPKSDSSQSTQSLSEAFIRFLENESRPQPQLKLLPEQSQTGTSRSATTSPKSLLLSELVLPTFSPSQTNESSSILKDVLRDS